MPRHFNPSLSLPHSRHSLHRILLLTFCLLLWGTNVLAQTARKPSFYEAPQSKRAAITATGDTSPATAMQKPSTRPFVGSIANQQEFDSLARVYSPGTLAAIPHVLFVIDRQQHNRIYYLDTPHFQLHERFVRAQKLLPHASRETINRNYTQPDRRFVFGTLSWWNDMNTFAYEFWEGDQITPELLALTDSTVQASFYAPVQFKTNSTLHEQVAQHSGRAFITQEALIREQPFMPLNTGHAQGRLRIIASVDATPDIQPDDIVVLQEVPITLPPVAGVVTQQPSTILSHVNLLAKGWGIPNAYIRNAAQALQAHDGQWVELHVSATGYQIKPMAQQQRTARTPRDILIRPDLHTTQLRPLAQLRTQDRTHCGAKAANLGTIRAARITGTQVPDGFCIPFAHYATFMQQDGIAQRIAALQTHSDPVQQREALAQLRQYIVQQPVQPATAAAWAQQWKTQLQGNGVFVRSSSNSEDLPHFSGAGLYTTVPNVRSAQALEDAVKQVWASVFNDQAYAARQTAGIPHNGVVMAVLVQKAINADSAGVMITRDPFNPTRDDTTYIAAKRGIGIKVVEGQRIAEQVMYSNWSKAIQVLSRSGESTELRLDTTGGVREIPTDTQRAVLQDDLVKRLARTGTAIKQLFGNQDQDIEWATQDGKILLLQARPYATGKP